MRRHLQAAGFALALIGFTTGVHSARAQSANTVHINEIESQGGLPDDWIELVNTGASPVNIGGWRLLDNDDTHIPFTFTSNATIPALGRIVVESASLGWGLGGADSVRLFNSSGALVETYTWVTHAATTYGRCPEGTGSFRVTTSATKAAANDCSSPVKINEVESDGGAPGDWVELYNPAAFQVDISGYIFRDNNDASLWVIPSGTSIPAGGYYVVEGFSFGLGGADSARLYDSYGIAVDAYAWASHATTTYGRCPNGLGGFTITMEPTKGTSNQCGAPSATVKINEIESQSDLTNDWVELFNPGPAEADLSGFVFKDNNDGSSYRIPANTRIPAGGFFVLDEAQFSFGIGANDSARLFDTGGALVDSYTWTEHAATTYGRCPDGTGTFGNTSSPTRGTQNICRPLLQINEVESDGGSPDDWIEIHNPTATAIDIGGFVFKDNSDASNYVIPSGSSVAAGGFFVVEGFTFGLGSSDSARLFDPTGNLIDSYAWTAHAGNTYGRCPDGGGAFTETSAATKGSANACAGPVSFMPWPGGANVQTVGRPNVFSGNLSSLAHEGSGVNAVLWGARNGPGALFRLVFNGLFWGPDTTNNWRTGKLLRYPDGTGDVDAEGVTYASGGSSQGLYVASERDNRANAVSRNSILRFDPLSPSSTLTATHEWHITGNLPANGANTGLEGIAWIPDAYLTSARLFDDSKGRVYNPSDYPNHGTGLFFVGVEASGMVYAFALDHSGNGAFTRISTISTGLTNVMDLAWDSLFGNLWAVCDDTCQGRSVLLRVGANGKFAPAVGLERPTGMPNLNNEGLAFASGADCTSNRRPVFWADDGETNGFSIRTGTMTCTNPFTSQASRVSQPVAVDRD